MVKLCPKVELHNIIWAYGIQARLNMNWEFETNKTSVNCIKYWLVKFMFKISLTVTATYGRFAC